MTDVKKLKVVLIKAGCQKIGGKCDSRRLLKSLNVRVYEFNYPLPELSLHIEIWEPLFPKKFTYHQQKIFYKDANLAIVIGEIRVFNGNCAPILKEKIDEAGFYLGYENVASLVDASTGAKNILDVPVDLIGCTVEGSVEILVQIQQMILEKFLTD